MNLLPLCTASVCPMKSGVMVLRRDQVLKTFFSFLSFRAVSFLSSDGSTYGPFFTERAITGSPSALAAADDELRGRLLLMTGLAALGLAPRVGGGPAARALTLAAAQRMVHRVHGHAPHPRHATEPAALPRLADRQQLVLGVADLPAGREALAA